MERLCDIIPDILLCLPIKSVVRFKCANNQLNNIVTDPKFANEHTRRHCPTKVEGLFNFAFNLQETLTSYMPLYLQNPRDKLENYIAREKLVNWIRSFIILDSCNGLVLLGLPTPSCFVCVLNPTTNQCQIIRKAVVSCSHRTLYHLRLAYDPNVFSSFDFKFVSVYWEGFVDARREVYGFKTFSSDTNFWTPSKAKVTCYRSNFLLKGKALYLNGFVHWVRRCGDIMAFDVRKEEARIIQLPRGLPNNCYDHAWFGVVGGFIYLVYVLEAEMVIWVLHDHENGRWGCVKHHIKSFRVTKNLYPIFFDDQWLILKSKIISSDVLAYNLKSNESWGIGKLPDSMELHSTDAQDVFFPFTPTLAVINNPESTTFAEFLRSRERKEYIDFLRAYQRMQGKVDEPGQSGIRPKRKIQKPARFNDY